MKQIRLASSAFVLALLVSLPASASLMERMDTRGLTHASQGIHIGQVTSKWSSWDPQKKMIYTYVKLKVDQTLKGDQREEVLIRQAGGQADGYGVVVHGMARFRPGERALVFLRNDADGAPSVVGMAQGKFRIFKSLHTGEEMAMFRAPADVEFYAKGEGGHVRHMVSATQEERVPLSQLLQTIRQAVSEEGSPTK